MESALSQVRSRWLIAAVLALLLGAQVAQSAHIHANPHFTPDCAQCSVDGGQALVVETETSLSLPTATHVHPDVLVAPVSTFYRLAARGPPTRSS